MFNELDSLLSESLEQVAEKRRQKQIVAKVRTGQATPQERQELAAAELQISWRAATICEFWEQTVCACGSDHSFFMQYMVEHEQVRGSAKRWVKTEPEDTPDGMAVTKVIYSQREVSHCSQCSEPPAGAEVIFWSAPDSSAELN